MGCDISAYINHTLDTSSITHLAKDLSDRLKAKISYGHYDKRYNFVVSGTIGDHPEEFELIDYCNDSDCSEEKVYKLQQAHTLDPYEINIYKDCFLSFTEYPPGRFSMFCDHFTGRYNFGESELEYRKLVMEEAQKYGGNIAIYTGDQCGATYVEQDVETTSFDVVLLKLKALSDVIYVSQFLRDLPGSYVKEHPDAFIDDFSYMPTSI